MVKIVGVKPLYRKRDIRNVQNYIPISVLSVFSKTLEKVMYNRITMFLNKYNVLTETQNGFRKKKSTDTANQSFTERIQVHWIVGYRQLAYFFYLTKVYDVLNHNTLLHKLNSYGVREI